LVVQRSALQTANRLAFAKKLARCDALNAAGHHDTLHPSACVAAVSLQKVRQKAGCDKHK